MHQLHIPFQFSIFSKIGPVIFFPIINSSKSGDHTNLDIGLSSINFYLKLSTSSPFDLKQTYH